jgi:hydroxymethylpyrimidine/phosphomethylpyrimidine kinase
MPVPRLLSIAGSDSGGGAGIQADLKAFARAGVHGMTAITAITAQNTVEVREVDQIRPAMIVAQVAAVAEDIGVDAVKIGMLGTAEVIAAVDEALDLLPADTPIVLDPVMVAESGAVLLGEDAREALRDLLVPRATVVTPNIPEARVLARDDDAASSPAELAVAVHGLGPRAAVVTGGHSEAGTDFYYDGDALEEITGERHAGVAAHGSGCTHSATLAAELAKGADLHAAACHAKEVASEAVRLGLSGLGGGPGPVDVFGLTEAPGREIPF